MVKLDEENLGVDNRQTEEENCQNMCYARSIIKYKLLNKKPPRDYVT